MSITLRTIATAQDWILPLGVGRDTGFVIDPHTAGAFSTYARYYGYPRPLTVEQSNHLWRNHVENYYRSREPGSYDSDYCYERLIKMWVEQENAEPPFDPAESQEEPNDNPQTPPS